MAAPNVDAAISETDRRSVVARIWSNDHTVRKPDLHALQAAGRRVVRVPLGDDPVADIRKLAGSAAE